MLHQCKWWVPECGTLAACSSSTGPSYGRFAPRLGVDAGTDALSSVVLGRLAGDHRCRRSAGFAGRSGVASSSTGPTKADAPPGVESRGAV